MLEPYLIHNQFRENLALFSASDPQLQALGRLKYQHHPDWWKDLDFNIPGIYILTGGRQVGKSTSCKLLIKHCLEEHLFQPNNIFYLPCDEIFDATSLSKTIRYFLQQTNNKPFLLVIDEITFVDKWERVIKALADEGQFSKGICVLTGSDTLILKEAAMSFPGRRGEASMIDFHLYPLSFEEYVKLLDSTEPLHTLFQLYLKSGGYLRAINDLAQYGEIKEATYLTYEQWIRGDFLKKGKSEETLLSILNTLMTVGVSQISFSKLTQKTGTISKETLIDYCRLLKRMDILFALQAFDQNKKQGFPRKDRKFHFTDPFIYQTILRWLNRENFNDLKLLESTLVESCVASYLQRIGKTFYFKGQGEIDVIFLKENRIKAIEVKWAEQIRPSDLKMLRHFKDSIILTKHAREGHMDGIKSQAVYEYLVENDK